MAVVVALDVAGLLLLSRQRGGRRWPASPTRTAKVRPASATAATGSQVSTVTSVPDGKVSHICRARSSRVRFAQATPASRRRDRPRR
ncbi:hypothetical protein GCM10020001_107270 [Nonomuraea salmonea]